MKFPDRAGTAVRAVELKGHGGDFGFWISDFGSLAASAPQVDSRILEEGKVLIDFPRRDLAVVGFPFAGLQLDEFVGNHSQPRADDAVIFELSERFGQ